MSPDDHIGIIELVREAIKDTKVLKMSVLDSDTDILYDIQLVGKSEKADEVVLAFSSNGNVACPYCAEKENN